MRKALGVVKDQTSIGLAKVSSNMAPELDVLVVKVTSHDDAPAEERHLREILHLTSYSRAYVSYCVTAVSRRLSKTRDWIVALKSLMLIHRLLADGEPGFHQVRHSCSFDLTITIIDFTFFICLILPIWIPLVVSM
jgi:ANTH domain